MKMPNGKMSRAAGAAAVAVVLLGASVLAVAKRPGHAGQPGQGHRLTKFPGFPVAQVVGPPNPQAVAPGSGAFTLRVFGANFTSSSVVNWNRQARATTFVSGHEVDAEILASDVATATAGIITVTNTTPGGTVTSSSYNFVEVHIPTATFVLGTEEDYAVPPAIGALIEGDVNGDGRLDLAIPSFSGAFDRIQTFLGNADGSFTAGKAATFGYYTGGGPTAFADFNGDGNLDLLYTSGPAKRQPPISVNVNLGNGDGAFRPGSHVAKYGLNLPCCAAIGDFNQDGVLDVAVAAGGADLYLGNGDGTFSKGGVIVNHAVLGMVAGDFNGDGKLDLAAETILQNPTRIEIGILLGNGDGTFQPARPIATINNSVSDTKLIATDLRGNGILDVVYTDNERLGVLLGLGDGTFSSPTFYSPPRVVTIVAGDFNSDGKMDVMISTGGPALAILLGNGDGTFQPAQPITVRPGTGSGSVIGDFNSDGLLDVAGLGTGITILLQK